MASSTGSAKWKPISRAGRPGRLCAAVRRYRNGQVDVVLDNNDWHRIDG